MGSSVQEWNGQVFYTALFICDKIIGIIKKKVIPHKEG